MPTTTATPEATESIDLAHAEHMALKAWERDGRTGEKPATPHYDAITASTPARRVASRKATGPKRTASTVRFTHDGVAVSDSMNKLSTLAWFFTKKIGGDDVKRLGVSAFRDVLKGLGVSDPEHTTWQVELPNGVTVGAVAPGDQAPPAPVKKAVAAKAPVKKAPAKKATPAKRTPAKTAAKKAPAKKATKTTGRQVTPRPKGSTRAPQKRTASRG